MKSQSTVNSPEFADDIDQFASRLLRNPDRAEILKQDFRSRIAQLQRATVPPPAPDGDLDDLWDNVPV
ncbi:MAG: hypothetical protein AAGK37_07860 [Pseudomonadota bacterium]